MSKQGLVLVAGISLLLLGACDSKRETLPSAEPVVVYAHGSEGDTKLSKLFAEFTDESGVRVTVRYNDSNTITNNVINNEGSPPADVLLTSNVADIWRAADQGALRPIQAAALDAVPEHTKDPDGFWTAFADYVAVIGQAKKTTGGASDYASLANPIYKNELCLSSSMLPINRAVMADLISALGAKGAERVVRGWVRNLALPPFDTEEKLIAALQSGACSYGIFSGSYPSDGVSRTEPTSLSYNVEGLGIARHARYPDSAQALVSWLIQREPSPMRDHDGGDIAVVGWLDEDARSLAERAGYR